MVVGLATGLAILGLFSPVAGVHVYRSVPVALSVVLCPRQSESSAGAITVDGCTTVIVTESIFSQPNAVVPLTMYVVVTTGVATGFGQLVQLRLFAGASH